MVGDENNGRNRLPEQAKVAEIQDRQNDPRCHNRALVLEVLRSRSPASRTELASTTTLSAPTVLEIVEELKARGLVYEDGTGPSTGGRRPVLLNLAPRARCSVGLAVGSRELSAAVVDLKGNTELRVRVPSGLNEGPAALAAQVKKVLRRVLGELPVGLGEPLGVGLALPAPVTASTGGVLSFPTREEWGELRIRELVADEFDLPVIVDNAANAAAVGEHLFGAGQGVRHMFYLLLHRGVGGASVVDGKVYRGADGGAGEAGHMRIDLNGPRCGCGNYGCLEAYVGRVAIRERAIRAMKLSGRHEMGGERLEELRAEDVVSAGLAGDELAGEVLRDTGKYLGVGIANMVHLLNPELVVVGGSTVRAGELLLKPAAEVLERQVLPSVAQQARVLPRELGEDAGAMGAAALVLRELFAVSALPALRQNL